MKRIYDKLQRPLAMRYGFIWATYSVRIPAIPANMRSMLNKSSSPSAQLLTRTYCNDAILEHPFWMHVEKVWAALILVETLSAAANVRNCRWVVHAVAQTVYS